MTTAIARALLPFQSSQPGPSWKPGHVCSLRGDPTSTALTCSRSASEARGHFCSSSLSPPLATASPRSLLTPILRRGQLLRERPLPPHPCHCSFGVLGPLGAHGSGGRAPVRLQSVRTQVPPALVGHVLATSKHWKIPQVRTRRVGPERMFRAQSRRAKDTGLLLPTSASSGRSGEQHGCRGAGRHKGQARD